MNFVAFRISAVIVCIFFTLSASAAVTGHATINKCAPAGGVSGYCEVKCGNMDPQQYHNMNCRLTKNGEIVDNFNGGIHGPSSGNETHKFPVPDLSTDWDEDVTFCIINYSQYWEPGSPVGNQNCTTTRGG